MRWYLGIAHERDTRFAWRMFAREDAVHCVGSYRLDGIVFDVRPHFSTAWQDSLAAGRASVIEGVARHVCSLHPGSELRLSLSCVDVGGAAVASDRRWDCS